jgi:hypothetical protein
MRVNSTKFWQRMRGVLLDQPQRHFPLFLLSWFVGVSTQLMQSVIPLIIFTSHAMTSRHLVQPGCPANIPRLTSHPRFDFVLKVETHHGFTGLLKLLSPRPQHQNPSPGQLSP